MLTGLWLIDMACRQSRSAWKIRGCGTGWCGQSWLVWKGVCFKAVRCFEFFYSNPPKKLCLKISQNIQSIPINSCLRFFFPRECFWKLAKVQRTSHHWYILGCLLWLGKGSAAVRDMAIGDWLTCTARFGETRRVGWWWSLALLSLSFFTTIIINHNRFYTYFLFVIYHGSHWTHCYHCFHGDLIIGNRSEVRQVSNNKSGESAMTCQLYDVSLFDSVTIRYDHIVGRTSSCVAGFLIWSISERSEVRRSNECSRREGSADVLDMFLPSPTLTKVKIGDSQDSVGTLSEELVIGRWIGQQRSSVLVMTYLLILFSLLET